MPRQVRRFVLAVLLSAAAPALARAVPHADTSVRPNARLALIVIETPGCFYCRLFRRDVRPAYEASSHAREVPMRFVDLKMARARRLALRRPVEVLPTVVVFRGGREVSRIAGYLPPRKFVRAINYLLSRTR